VTELWQPLPDDCRLGGTPLARFWLAGVEPAGAGRWVPVGMTPACHARKARLFQPRRCVAPPSNRGGLPNPSREPPPTTRKPSARRTGTGKRMRLGCGQLGVNRFPRPGITVICNAWDKSVCGARLAVRHSKPCGVMQSFAQAHAAKPFTEAWSIQNSNGNARGWLPILAAPLRNIRAC
jgi:hypothetical protein